MTFWGTHSGITWRKVAVHTAFWLLFVGCIALAVPRIALTFSCEFSSCHTERTCGWATYQVANGNPLYSSQYMQGPYANVLAYAPVYFYCTGLTTKLLCGMAGWNTFFAGLTISRILTLAFMLLALLIVSDLLRRSAVPMPWCIAPFAVVALSPEIQRFMSECRTDTLAMCLELLVVWCAVTMKPGRLLILAIAVFGSAAVFTRQTAAVGCAVALIIAIAYRDRRNTILIGLGLSAIISACLLGWLYWSTEGAAFFSLFRSQGKLPYSKHHWGVITRWSFWSYLMTLVLVASPIAGFLALKSRSRHGIALFLYALLWMLIATLMTGKIDSECNYYLTGQVAMSGCFILAFYTLSSRAPIALTTLAFIITTLCVVTDVTRLRRLTSQTRQTITLDQKWKHDIAKNLKRYNRVLSRHCDILASQSKPVYMVDQFTISMLNESHWYTPTGVLEHIRHRYYDAVVADAALYHNGSRYLCMPGLKTVVFANYCRIRFVGKAEELCEPFTCLSEEQERSTSSYQKSQIPSTGHSLTAPHGSDPSIGKSRAPQDNQ